MSKNKKKIPLKKKIRRWIERTPYNLHELKWWFLHRFHPGHRYHVIHTGLKPGWRDRDYLLEHLMVKILIDFVEKEKPFEDFDTEDSSHRETWAQIKDLYEFFKANDHAEMRREELTPYLIKIVELRGHYWT